MAAYLRGHSSTLHSISPAGTLPADRYRVLIAHNRYIYRGGEDSVVDAECALLKSRGHKVEFLLEDNRGLVGQNPANLVLEAIWSRRTVKKLKSYIESFKPDIVHVHNFFPQISPSIFWAASLNRTPVIMTLHNFRYSCANGTFMRAGRICESCLSRASLQGVLRKCYRNSFAQSLTLTSSFIFHKFIGTFRRKVTFFIVLTDFARRKFIECGLPPEKLVLKANFADIPANKDRTARRGGLYVGRLSEEKGIGVLLDTIQSYPLGRVKFVGDGAGIEAARNCPQADYLGWKSSGEVYDIMRSASYLVVPSICYETFGRTIVEAFACGLPVIASRLGSLSELIEDGKTGLLFEPGVSKDLAKKILWAESHPRDMLQMGSNARRVYEEKYTPDANYEQLISVYTRAIQSCSRSQGSYE